MAISVQVPKDLSGIKTKVALNLTKRQIICFSGAAVTGIPLYFLTKGLIGTSAASLLMMGAMLPFFFFAMYEKNGFPAEKILYFMLRQKILTPGIRPYRSENLYKQLEEKEKLRREVRYLEEKAKYENELFKINALGDMDILDIDKTEEENPHNRPGVKFGDEEEDGEGYE